MYPSIEFQEKKLASAKSIFSMIGVIGPRIYAANENTFFKICSLDRSPAMQEENLNIDQGSVSYSRRPVLDTKYKRLMCTQVRGRRNDAPLIGRREYHTLINLRGTQLVALQEHHKDIKTARKYIQFNQKYMGIFSESNLSLISLPTGKLVVSLFKDQLFGSDLRIEFSNNMFVLSMESKPGVVVLICKEVGRHWSAC